MSLTKKSWESINNYKVYISNIVIEELKAAPEDKREKFMDVISVFIILKVNEEVEKPEACKSYLEEGHKKDTVYRTRNNETESKLEFLLKQSKTLYDTGKQAGRNVIENQIIKYI